MEKHSTVTELSAKTSMAQKRSSDVVTDASEVDVRGDPQGCAQPLQLTAAHRPR